jgi:phosphocarrier protein
MFEAELWIRNGEKTINGKSIMGVLTLAASKGTVLVIEADGPDREDALQAIHELINDRFGEEE